MFKPKLFTKYMLTYTALFFIPVLILAFQAFNVFNNVLNKEINSGTSSLLEQAKNSIDSRMQELNKLAIQVSNNPYLTSSFISGDYMNVILAVNLLNNFSIPNSFYDNFYIYYFDHRLLYSPTGTVNPHYFSSTLSGYRGWSLEDMQKDISSNPSIYVRAATLSDDNKPSQKAIVYAVPLPYMNEKPSGAIFFTIQEKTIYNILKETLNANKSSVLILDGMKQPITMMGSLPINALDLSAFPKGDELHSKELRIAGASYFVSGTTSSQSGWTYISFLPANAVKGKLSGLKTTTFTLFVGLFVVGVLLIHFFMKINYKPLGELTRQAAKLLGIEGQGSSGGLESVQSAVDHMSRKITDLEAKYEVASPVMKQRLLLRLLKGEFTDPEEFAAHGKEFGLSISSDKYCVVNVMVDPSEAASNTEAASYLRDLLVGRYHVFTLENVLDDQIILILSDERNNSIHCDEICSDLIDKLRTQMGLSATIGLGNWFASLSSISESYLQACSALDYRLVKGKGTVIPYREVETHQNGLGHSARHQLELLEKYFTDRDEARFTQTLDSVFKSIKEKRIPLMSAKLLCYDVVQTIVHAIYRNNYYLKEDMEDKIDIITLSQYETVEELSDRIKALCSDIFFHSAGKEQSANKQIEKIKEYILRNYDDCNFSLQGLSDHVGMSVSYVSHYFKAQETRNISDFVNDLRMSKAKSLLTEERISLQEVAQKVGYLNLSSFIRKFKQTTGVTPGAFRDLSRVKT